MCLRECILGWRLGRRFDTETGRSETIEMNQKRMMLSGTLGPKYSLTEGWSSSSVVPIDNLLAFIYGFIDNP